MLNRSEMVAFSFSWRAAGCAAYGCNEIGGQLHHREKITGADRTKRIPPEINITSVVSWANQSFAIATRPDVQYCVQKDDDACWYADDQKGYRGGAQHVVTVDDAYLAAQAATVREQ